MPVFEGFTASAFDLFEIPDFAGRMGAIRSVLKPRLGELGEDLAARIQEIAGTEIHPHVAQHMRRRVNPPVETWVAFGRDRRGYKRWGHFRVGVSAAGVRTTMFVEDDSDDKARFGEALTRHAGSIVADLAGQGPVRWFTIGDERGTSHADLRVETLVETGRALQRLKTLKFQAGVEMPREQVLVETPEGLEAWIMSQVRLLLPLYRSACDEGGGE
jgi:uncharacterized protein YktB (UPF0637 family)